MTEYQAGDIVNGQVFTGTEWVPARDLTASQPPSGGQAIAAARATAAPQQTVVFVDTKTPKSALVAGFLTFFLGALGMFYLGGSVGVVSLILSVVVFWFAVSQQALWLIVAWWVVLVVASVFGAGMVNGERQKRIQRSVAR